MNTEHHKHMILNTAQATAIYRAMCELNNIGARISVRGIKVGPFEYSVMEIPSGKIVINDIMGTQKTFANQGQFCQFYGILP